MSVRVRFAPSPSGYLHIGGARTALFNWLWARHTGGKFILRVEDTDLARSSESSVEAVLDALRWLGLEWDEGPGIGGEHAPYFQSQRQSIYQSFAQRLLEQGLAYRCYSTKEELDALREEQARLSPKQPFRYPGIWRDRTDWPSDGRPYVIRFKTPHAGVTTFWDKVYGVINTPNAEQHDFVILRSDGLPLYNWAAVIDDHLMGINLVVRANDHLGNTPLQILLYRALGWEPPEFAHLPLMLALDGHKLSKRHAAVSIQEYRDKGYTPDAVLSYLARFGWSHGDQEIFSRQELIDLFSWERVGKSDGKFDERKFADVAFEHLKQERLLGLKEYGVQVTPWLARRGLVLDDPARLEAAIASIRPRAKTLVEAAEAMDFYFREPPELDPKAQEKFLTPEVAPALRGLREALGAVPSWQAQAIEQEVLRWAEGQKLAMKDFAQPARVALTGRRASPGLYEVMEVLGRERSSSRLLHGAELAGG